MSISLSSVIKTGALLVFLLMSACTSIVPRQSLELLSEFPDIEPRVELETVPFYEQSGFQGGPAALAIMINYHGKDATLEQLIPQIYVQELESSSFKEMLAAANFYDLLAIEQDKKLESIVREIAQGNPVLVKQDLGFDNYPLLHYAVVVGYDLMSQTLFLRSGEVKRLELSFVDFEKSWGRAGYVSVLIVPPTQIPATVTEEDYTRAVISLAFRASARVSIKAYQYGLRRWPYNYQLQMGLGRASFNFHNYALAETAYSKAIEVQQESTDAWNMLAYSLLKQNKVKPALVAINQAIRLSPDDDSLKKRRLEILEVSRYHDPE